jgi:hypothetical protein
MKIQRIVCFKFIAGVSKAAVDQHMKDFAGMKADIPQIIECRGGLTIPGDPNTPPEFDSLHYMTFASMADIEIYNQHAAHQAFIQNNKQSWQKVLVLNAEIP